MTDISPITGTSAGAIGALLIVVGAAIARMMDRRARPACKLVDQENARLVQRFADVQTRRKSEGLLQTLHAAGRDGDA